jgi:regulator of protease activity HflC (stomatin/prohibitin superfamily)
MFSTFFLIALVLALIVIKKTFLVVSTRELVVKENFGKFSEVLDPGLHILIPFIDNAADTQEMREQVLHVPLQSCITKDNIQVEVDGLVYLKVMDAHKASYGIANYQRAAVNLAQTTMRSEIGKMDLDETFSERDHLNENIVTEVDKASDTWGIKVLRYEIRNITPSKGITETLEKQMEAERAKRAEIVLSNADKSARINKSEGERQHAINLSEGSKESRVLIAEGKAKEMELISTATAEGIALVASAIAQPGGALAVKTQLTEQYIEQLGKVLEQSEVQVLPPEYVALKAQYAGIAEVVEKANSKAE